MIFQMQTIRVYEHWHYIFTSTIPLNRVDSRISQNADHNKMTVQNLANIFGPTLLGSDTSGSEDTRAQIRVAETIISYALDMFELGTVPAESTLTRQKMSRSGIFSGHKLLLAI